MDGIRTDDPANLALEFFQTRHAFSVKRKASIAEEYFGDALNIRTTEGCPVLPAYFAGGRAVTELYLQEKPEPCRI